MQAFHLTWDAFPGPARLIDRRDLTRACNTFAKERGLSEGQICAKVGSAESHKGCKKAVALEEQVAQVDRPMEEKIHGWLPVEGYPDIVIHFVLNVPKENE